MAEEKKNPLGPTGEQVRANVERVRESRGMTKKQLADRVSELGRPIPPLGISRIEAGTRRVDADDLVALAIALRVSPATLLLPWGPADGSATVTAAGPVTAAEAWMWADGIRPLKVSEQDPHGDVQRYQLDSRPAWARDDTWRAGQVGYGERDERTGLYEWYERMPLPGVRDDS
ncbi:helix-turn-helix domain-containing protein [Streptomyces sp. NPDC017966]|uniref:helix-turn-helix domain-containing protein n=1 Tax=Streptomyces sp. NPDC017966 TaxID=3365023 RepID=UPI0037ABE4F5